MKSASPPVLRATRLLDQARERIRCKYYSLRTEQAYVQWVYMFVKWHGLRHPRDMGQLEIEGFLAILANERRVAAATHKQAWSALLFLYREVLDMNSPWVDGVQRPRTPKRTPSVSAVAQVAALLSALPTDMALLARLLYGTGMRLMEGLRLRVKDVDFDRGVLVVRQAKGDKDRVLMLPRSLAAELRQQMLAARALWEQDRHAQRGGVDAPHAPETKYPGMGKRWGLFWVFPVSSLSVDPRKGVWQPHPLHEERLEHALKNAVAQAGILTSGDALPGLRWRR